MKPYKEGDGLLYNGKKFIIYDVCMPCKRVSAKDENGVKHRFKYINGGLILSESEGDSVVSDLLSDLQIKVQA